MDDGRLNNSREYCIVSIVPFNIKGKLFDLMLYQLKMSMASSKKN